MAFRALINIWEALAAIKGGQNYFFAHNSPPTVFTKKMFEMKIVLWKILHNFNLWYFLVSSLGAETVNTERIYSCEIICLQTKYDERAWDEFRAYFFVWPWYRGRSRPLFWEETLNILKIHNFSLMSPRIREDMHFSQFFHHLWRVNFSNWRWEISSSSL